MSGSRTPAIAIVAFLLAWLQSWTTTLRLQFDKKAG